MNKGYPLWCIHSEEKIIGDRKIDDIEIAVKPEDKENWTVLYRPNSLLDAQFYLKRLKDLYDTDISRFLKNEIPTMFEYADQVYKCEYVFPEQSCICGNDISGNTAYGEYNPSGVKIDYLHSTVFFYYKGECLVKANRLFLDGNLILDSKELMKVCEEIGQNFSHLNSSPDKLIKWIVQNYPEATTYECNGYCSMHIGE